MCSICFTVHKHDVRSNGSNLWNPSSGPLTNLADHKWPITRMGWVTQECNFYALIMQCNFRSILKIFSFPWLFLVEPVIFNTLIWLLLWPNKITSANKTGIWITSHQFNQRIPGSAPYHFGNNNTLIGLLSLHACKRDSSKGKNALLPKAYLQHPKKGGGAKHGQQTVGSRVVKQYVNVGPTTVMVVSRVCIKLLTSELDWGYYYVLVQAWL